MVTELREPAGARAAPATGQADVVIRAIGLAKRYDRQMAVDDVSFEVRRGEVFGFLGPNGSGKSTTIGMILGLVQPTRGYVELFGQGPERRGEGLARVGAIIEGPAFYPYLSAFDNLAVLSALRGGVSVQRIHDILDLVGLLEAGSKPFSKFSLGMKQRLGIGWTLLDDPEVIVLDEPTNGLDPAGMQEVRHLILTLSDAGKTVFLSSHLLNEVEQVCDRVAIIQRGKIVAEGSVDDLVRRGQRALVITREARRAAEFLRGLDGVTDVRLVNGDVSALVSTLRPADLAVALVQAGIDVDEVRGAGSNLEQVFLEITEGSEAAHGE